MHFNILFQGGGALGEKTSSHILVSYIFYVLPNVKEVCFLPNSLKSVLPINIGKYIFGGGKWLAS